MKKHHKTSIGGQALIEGILMRGPGKMSVVIRKPDGTLLKNLQPVVTMADKNKLFKKPFFRGIAGLFESMKLGMGALVLSADVFAEEEEEKEEVKKEGFFQKHREDIEIALTMVFSIGIALLVFFLIPTWIANFFKTKVNHMLALNLIEGIVRIIFFFLYILLIAKSKDIYRVLQYHGAEHKSIHCYEHGEELTVENVRKYSRLHPRCGTSFVFTVIILSVFILSFFGWPNPWMRVLIRILMLPVIVGISYEINKFLGGSDSKLARFLIKPGLWIQKVATTKEPEDEMLEVAIEALTMVIPEQEGLDNW